MAINTVQRIDDAVAVKTALISVYHKLSLDALVARLVAACPGLRIMSTGGTFDRITEILGSRASRVLTQVSDYTGQPEMHGGLVKTLNYKIYLGLLSETYNASHQADLVRLGAVPIDMVVSDLYPFGSTIAVAGVTPEMARAHVDIGGPCMVRAAAKNFHRVAVVMDPADFDGILSELEFNGGNAWPGHPLSVGTEGVQHNRLL